MIKFSIKYSDESLLTYPFGANDIVKKIMSGVFPQSYILEDESGVVDIPTSRLEIVDGSSNSNVLEKLGEVSSKAIKNIDTVKKALEVNQDKKIGFNALLKILESESLDFKPKKEGVYVEIADDNYIPLAYYTIDEFLSYEFKILNSDKDSILNNELRNFRLILVVDDNGLKNDYISQYYDKVSVNMVDKFTKTKEFLDVYKDMNKLSKLHLIEDKIEVI